jgi:hypothetical protein
VHHSYQVFKNLDPTSNPRHLEGKSSFEFIGVADCPGGVGPVDASKIPGLKKKYSSVGEFQMDCEKKNYIAREYVGTSEDVKDQFREKGKPDPEDE